MIQDPILSLAVADAFKQARSQDELRRALSTLRPKAKRLAIFALGKGAIAAARTAEDVFAERPLEGLVVTPQGFAAQKDVKHLEVLETSHPLPDASSEAAGNRILSLASSLSEADAAICLISGGASACATATIPPLELADKINLSATLLRGGAAIETINAARKHLSRLKGGRLACAIFPAETFSFVASDVIGDDPSVIASGPTVGDPTTQAETRDILRRYGAEGSPRLEAVLCDPRNESPKPDEARLSRSARPLLVSRPRDMLDAARRRLEREGFAVIDLGDSESGESRETARRHARRVVAEARRMRGTTFSRRGAAILSGGETSVTLGSSSGLGGPNGEYLLALLIELSAEREALSDVAVSGVALDTDGIDGSGGAAGAALRPDSATRASAMGMSPRDFLDRHDSLGFFERLGDAVVVGPSGANANDLRIALLRPLRS